MKHLKWRSLFLLATLGCLIPLAAQAQVVEDGTTSTTVNQDGNNFTINQGDRVGDNLFHSFDEFSVPTMGSAVFNNAGDIANIFSRVTGSNISDIDGLIGANGAANLFLINPNGIIFGENASLNLGGSFFASTADSLLFEGNSEFSATNPQAAPLLEVSIPIGLNFRDNPGEIVNRSFVQNNAGDFVGLEVAPGKDITLVGGNINFETGRATAKGGNIQLGGLSAAGTVGINEDGSLSFPEDVAQADINLINAASVNVAGTGGGSITINARNLNLATGTLFESIFGNNSQLKAGITVDSTSADIQAGDIKINVSENTTLDNSSIVNQVDAGGVGNSGNIFITTGSLTLTNGGRVDASTFGQGDAGSVNITATDTITFDGETSDGSFNSGVFSRVEEDAEGNGGDINITTGSLNVTNGGQVNTDTRGKGDAGSIDITATDTITFDGEDSNGTASQATSDVRISEAEGNAGNINITTASLNVTNGGDIGSSTLGKGDAGSVNITATDTITIDGEAPDGFPNSRVLSAVTSEAEGNGGNINITTGSLTLTNGGLVDADTSGQGNAGSIDITATDTITIDGEDSNGIPSQITSDVLASETVVNGEDINGGDINITTGSLTLKNRGRITASTFSKGDAGNLSILADNIEIDGGENGLLTGLFASVEAEATGQGGNITIGSEQLPIQNLTLRNGGQIVANTFNEGDAGNVSILADNTINIDGENSDGLPNSGVFSQVNSGAVGNGGDINITTGSLNVTNGGRVIADTFGQGNAGSINITATDTITFDGEESDGIPSQASSDVVTSEAVGNGGNIKITTGSLTLTNGGNVGASTEGQGNAGSVEIIANDTITIDGEADSSVFLDDTFLFGGNVVASTIGKGNAGGVTITTGSLNLKNGGIVAASTTNQGKAGNVTVNARESINISGVSENNPSLRSGIFATASTVTSEAGNVNVFTNQLTIDDGARISVSSPEGLAGNLNVTANSLFQNGGNITSETRLSEGDVGANINLEISDIWRIENESQVSATAFGDADGGNININQGLSDTEFLLFAFPPTGANGSDITANAEQGNGGRIDITAAGVFGIEFRDEQTPLNDFTVSSQFGASGETIINRTVDDPTSGLIELPQAVGDASDQISQNPCEQGVGSEFIVTGKGGLPPNVNEALNSEEAQVDLIKPLPQPLSYKERGAIVEANGISTEENSTSEAVPAMGWVFNDKGEVTLTAYSTSDREIQRSPQQTSSTCSVSSFENH